MTKQKPRFLDLPGRHALIAWRAEKGWAPKDVAESIPIALETYSRIEAGIRRPPETIRPRLEEVTGGAVKIGMWNLQ